MAYVTNTEVANYLGLDTSDAIIMVDISAKIDLAESLIEDFCGWEFTYSETPSIKYLDGSGTDILNLPKFLTTLTAVAIVDSSGTEASTYTISDIQTEPLNPRKGAHRWLQLKGGGHFPKGIGNIKVTGTWGLSVIPNSFKLAVMLTVKNLYDIIPQNPNILREREMDREIQYQPIISPYKGTASTLANPIPPFAQTILRQFMNGGRYFNEE